jgi:hypothetical protein
MTERGKEDMKLEGMVPNTESFKKPSNKYEFVVGRSGSY